MEASFLERHQKVHDALNFIVFIALVIAGTMIINTFVFRSFNVVGPSMESTMYTGDRLIVNRLPVTWSKLQNEPYIPDRSQIIVFNNPKYIPGEAQRFIVKRVIAFPGERVVVKNGELTVYNDENPTGFSPDDLDQSGTPASPTSGEVDTIVPDGTLFVAGDNRIDQFSSDSRNGLGTIPFFDVIGPVSLRVWPVTSFEQF